MKERTFFVATSDFSLNQFLLRYKYLLLAISAVFIVMVHVQLWFILPYSDLLTRWSPDNVLVIDAESGASQYIESQDTNDAIRHGDRILAIDGRPVVMGKPLYTFPRKASYTLTIKRGDDISDVEVFFPTRPGSIALQVRVPATVLSFISWLVGFISIYFAKDDEVEAVQLGFIFVLAGTMTIGIQGYLLGAFLSWLFATPALFVMIICWVYLGVIPYSKRPLSATIVRLFRYAFGIAVLLAAVSVFEILALFPRFTSIEQLTGFSMYRLGLLWQSFGLILGFSWLIYRIVAEQEYYERQQVRIVALFTGLAIFPALFLTFIPALVLGEAIFPFPVAIIALLLVPLGHLFVIYRRGNPHLDNITSRIVLLISMALSVLLVYGVSLFSVERVWGALRIAPASLALIPTITITIMIQQRIDQSIQRTFFGGVVDNLHLPSYASALSTKPELTTLQAIIESVSSDFLFQHVVLVLKDKNNLYRNVAQVNASEPTIIHSLDPEFSTPLLKAANPADGFHPLGVTFPWAEMFVPIMSREKMMGVLVLSKPYQHGFFNLREIDFFTRLADMLAVGNEAITLFESSKDLALRLTTAREQERRRIASDIHDRPLQLMGRVSRGLKHLARIEPKVSDDLRAHIEDIDEAQAQLRQLCVQLYPTTITQGPELVVRDVVYHFSTEQELDVETQIDFPDDFIVPPNVSSVIHQVLTESLNNVVKHAGARQAIVKLSFVDEIVKLAVQDNGKGFKHGEEMSDYNELLRNEHIGLASMLTSAQSVDGRLEIETLEKGGTQIALYIPLSEELALGEFYV